MPSRNSAEKTWELASRSPNDTSPLSLAIFSDITQRPTERVSLAPDRRRCPAPETATCCYSCRKATAGCPEMAQENSCETRKGTGKKSRRCRRLKVDNREASNRVDRSHSCPEDGQSQ